MATEETQKQPDKLALAGAVSSRVEIKNVRLVETLAKHPIGAEPSDLSIFHSAHTALSDDQTEILVLARFQVISGQKKAAEEQAPAEPALVINATFALTYNLKSAEGIQTPNLDAFGELNGIYNCWPYWREYVSQMTGRFGLPPLTLPVFQPTRGLQKKKPARIDETGASKESSAAAKASNATEEPGPGSD